MELTHGNHWWNAIASLLNIDSRDDDRWLLCLPPHHVGGLSILLKSLIYGVSVVAHDGFDAEAVNRAIDDESISMVSVVSTMLSRMLHLRNFQPYPASLRCVLLGGGPIPSGLSEQCMAAGVPIAPTYGLTETASQAATLRPSEVAQHPGSAGKPLFPIEMVVETDSGLGASNQAGEILVRGQSVSSGYCNQAADDAWRDGWFHTGDIGSIDADGYLYVYDRRSDLIVTGGENVFPADVESVLSRHPGIVEVAVFGVPDPEWGQAVIAAIVPHDGYDASLEEIRGFVGESLAPYQIPKMILVLSELPKTASGKLLRSRLRDNWVVDS